MENTEILKLWKQYDEKLEKTLSLNQRIITELQHQKAKNALQPAKRIKWINIIIGLLYVSLLVSAEIYLWERANIFLLGSIGGHLLVCVFAIAMYTRQLVLIHEIDVSEDVFHIQKKLAKLKTSTLKIVGICFLQLPLFSTWNITYSLIVDEPFNFWLIQVPIVLLFTGVGIWMYRIINPKNVEKRWFKIMFCGSEWASIIRSGKILQELDELAN